MRLFSSKSRRGLLLFVVDREEHVQRGVAAVAVVDRLHVLEHGGPQHDPAIATRVG
jgi:hypothetical protein